MNVKDFIFYTNYMIGSGGTMKAYYAKNKINKANAVVKIAQIKKSSSIEKKVYILRKLQDQNNIPNLYDYNFNDNTNILVESLLGPYIDF